MTSDNSKKRTKALNKEFAPKILPRLGVLDKDILENIKYPIFLQPIPEGMKVFIRSGILQFDNGDSVKNINLKSKLRNLIVESRRLKVTLECIINTKGPSKFNEQELRNKLSDFTGNVEDTNFYIVDMVFEHSPEALDFSARMASLKPLFRSNKIGEYPKLLDYYIIHSDKELEEYMLSNIIVNKYENFVISSPHSRYKFGNVEDLFESEGGIAELQSRNMFSGKLIKIIPRVSVLKGKETYIADSVIVKYNNGELEIPLHDTSIVILSNMWNSREELKGNNVIFSGIYIPGYSYPKYRSFIRFEKLK